MSDDRDLAAARIVARQLVEEDEPVAQQARCEEMAAHVLLALQRAGARLGRVAQDLDAGLRTLLRGVDEPARLVVIVADEIETVVVGARDAIAAQRETFRVDADELSEWRERR